MVSWKNWIPTKCPARAALLFHPMRGSRSAAATRVFFCKLRRGEVVQQPATVWRESDVVGEH
jgi:hypothetical protein